MANRRIQESKKKEKVEEGLVNQDSKFTRLIVKPEI